MKKTSESIISRSTKSRIVGRASITVDLDVQRREHRGVFEADHAGPDDDDVAREHIGLEQLVRVDDPFAVERNGVAVRGPRAAGDQHVVGGDGRRPLRRRDLEGVRIQESRAAREGRDPVAIELRADDLDLAGQHLLDAEARLRIV